MYDLLIKGGHLIDPSQGLSAKKDLALSEGKVACMGEDIAPRAARQTLDAADRIVRPGLIDLHVHIYQGVSHYGIAADPTCLAKGVTTAVDAGSSGAQTFPGLRQYVIEVSSTRLYAFLNLSLFGMISRKVGELEDLRYVDKKQAIQVVEDNRDVIQGIKIRLSRSIAGEHDLAALKLARETSDAVGMPMMVHVGGTASPLKDILAEMKGGDIVTHCFHGHEHGVLDGKGKVLPEVRKAVERGVILDVGHGAGSFTFEVAKKAMAQELVPQTISSDLHVYNLNGPVFDLATTVSKFLHLGLPLEEAIRRVTETPAKVLGMEKILGTLQVDAVGDVSIFHLEEGEFILQDTAGQTEMGRKKLTPRTVVKDGKIYPSE